MILADIFQLWQSAWPAGVTMLVLGLGFAIVLLIASEKLKVEVDEKIEQIHEALPNIDCGACGFAGCASYAKAVAADAELVALSNPATACVEDNIARCSDGDVSANDVVIFGKTYIISPRY